MKAIVVTDQAVGTTEMKLVERPDPQAAINDAIIQIHASGFVPSELAWSSSWTDRLNRDRTPSNPRHEPARHEPEVISNSHGVSFRAARMCQDVVHA